MGLDPPPPVHMRPPEPDPPPSPCGRHKWMAPNLIIQRLWVDECKRWQCRPTFIWCRACVPVHMTLYRCIRTVVTFFHEPFTVSYYTGLFPLPLYYCFI